MKKTKQKNQYKARAKNQRSFLDYQQTVAEHLQELRKRLIYVAASIVIFSTTAYFIQQKIVNFLLKPASNQRFIYTAPGGGLSFLFQVCIYVGIVFSIPVFMYQTLRFIEPVIRNETKSYILKLAVFSAVLAVAGFSFGYILGLPIILHFLSHQFTTNQIKPLLSIQEYMSFISVYLIGSSLIFQLPLIILFINKIKPLKPKQLLSYERYVFAGAFIISILMAPTVNIIDQLLLAGPIIVAYQVAMLAIIIGNRRAGTKQISRLLKHDEQSQSDRQNAVSASGASPLMAESVPDNISAPETVGSIAVNTLVKNQQTSMDIVRKPAIFKVAKNRIPIEVQFE